MTRKLIALVLLAWLAPGAKSQDMPLSQILIEGEGWKKVEGKPVKPDPLETGADPAGGEYSAESPDGITRFRYVGDGKFIHIQNKGGHVWPPYCQLRTKFGEKRIEVLGLRLDEAGRIYALTEIGVQVFDPTGRLCGVLTPAARGKPELMMFEGDQLTLWIGDTKYTRKLNTTGVK